MKYNFNYFRTRNEKEKHIEIVANNDVEAVLKFFDMFGDYEFGCIREDGTFFTDDKFPKERMIILNGC